MVLKGAGKSKLKKKTGDRRQKKSPILDTGYSMLDTLPRMLDTPGKDEQKG
jgi:hypothetical protein